MPPSAPEAPVLHWSLAGEWEPILEASGQRAAWPAGLDPAQLPRPRCNLRERVLFRWRHRRLRGEIRDIKLSGARLEYIIYTGGHGYWVSEDQLE